MSNPRETKVRIRFLDTVTTTPWDHLPGDVIETNLKKARALQNTGYAEIVSDDTPLTADNPPDVPSTFSIDSIHGDEGESQETDPVEDAPVDTDANGDADVLNTFSNESESTKETEMETRKSVVPDKPSPQVVTSEDLQRRTSTATRKGKRKATSR